MTKSWNVNMHLKQFHIKFYIYVHMILGLELELGLMIWVYFYCELNLGWVWWSVFILVWCDFFYLFFVSSLRKDIGVEIVRFHIKKISFLNIFNSVGIQQDNFTITEGAYSLYFNFSLNEVHPMHKAHEQTHFQLPLKESSNPFSEISTNFFFSI